MKRLLWILLLTGSLQYGKAQTSASFNFSLAPQSVSGWVNIYSDPSVAVRSGTSNGITVSSIATDHWVPLTAVGSAYDNIGIDSNGFFPAGVLYNHWFQYSSLGQYNEMYPQLQISGLSRDSVYTIAMTGSSTSANSTNPTQYTVAGRTVFGYIQVNTHNNVHSGATFNNVLPDTNGIIRVYVNTVPATQVGDICGIQVTRGHTNPPPTIVITSPENNDVLTEDGYITINAAASESGGSIVKVQFYVGDTTKIGESTTAPYSAAWINPDLGQYKITAVAVDALGNSNSTSINVSVESLTSFWSMTGNIAMNPDSNFVGNVDSVRLAFRTHNLERMSILGDGTVGIGTTNTYGYKLAVNGTAIFTKVRVKTAGTWPDYVFKKGYALPDLNQLEKYIAAHQHLPGIVSETEANHEGVDVGDNQAALLKKVEELTLYLIEQNKRLKAQQQQIDALKKLVRKQK